MNKEILDQYNAMWDYALFNPGEVTVPILFRTIPQHGGFWMCVIESGRNEQTICEGVGDTPEDAIAACYANWTEGRNNEDNDSASDRRRIAIA